MNRGHSKNYAPTEAEFARMLGEAEDLRDRICLEVLGHSGLRAREFQRTEADWLRDGKIHVPPRAAKTPASVRAVPLKAMEPAAWDLLSDYLDRKGRFDWCYGTTWNRVRKAGERAGLPRQVFPHALRAMVASRWARRLGNPFALQELMGWTTLGVAVAYVRHSGLGAERAVLAWREVQGRRENGGPHVYKGQGSHLEAFRDRYRRRGRR